MSCLNVFTFLFEQVGYSMFLVQYRKVFSDQNRKVFSDQ